MQNNFIIIPPLHDTSNFALETAIVLAKKNLVVLYEHTLPVSLFSLNRKDKLFQNIKKNLYLFRSVHFLPLERFSVIYNLNRALSLLALVFWGKVIQRKRRTIFWLLHPSFVWMLHLREIFLLFNTKFLYDCVDFFSVDYQKTLSRKNILASKNEATVVKKSDLVTANSYTLLRYCKTLRKDVQLVPQGFRLQSFASSKQNDTIVFSRNKPIIGYVGGINRRLDISLLSKLVRNNKQWDFVLWGPIQHPIPRLLQQLLTLKNVVTGESKKTEIRNIIQQFDIAIIPYTQNIFNSHSFPVKLFEYFYCGKPVVSSPIKELDYYSKYVSIAKTALEWQTTLDTLTKHSWSKSFALEQRKIAVSHSWENKIAVTEKALENVS
ncbi:MAG: hypothetical protein A3A82_02775 [Candidatus Pacebacteria bacterium RIFCSPLOWO2_01_FULL_47_12]|nr:MAG: hypothetical protein A3J60_01625 [Candidatus Pacebacteria bacterium RIFCSPHIGHO2_02_FULL_46_9]OGJ37403.1 MAG: hypothetical protein A3A82_02775 [Candidatus Pacebacteria bacterium RIFCSPLOWO2_01_FULL_47_12]